MDEKQIKKNSGEKTIHKILIESYSLYFLFFLVGVVLDSLFPIKILDYLFFQPAGLLIALSASFLIFWAQKSSRKLDKQNLSKETFSKGPYKYIRHPTQLGLFLLLLGLGMMTNAIYLILITLFYFFFAERVFIKKEDAILEAKYGEPFIEYKKSVGF